jgi:hypothetical protein
VPFSQLGYSGHIGFGIFAVDAFQSGCRDMEGIGYCYTDAFVTDIKA